MRWIALFLAGVVGGCAGLADGPAGRAAAPVQSGQDSPVAELPPQSLPAGACGLFLFERRAPNRFVMFENQTSRTVKIVHDGRIHELGVTEQRGALVTGESFRRVYLDSTHNLTFTLTGEVGEETGSGPRLENVLLTVRALDSSRVVRPLGGVRSCREAQG